MQRTPPEKNDQWAAMDGDTIKSSKGDTVHLYGIDAPESKQLCYTNKKAWRCGRESKQMLQNFIMKKQISCELMDIDIYNRHIKDCSANGKSVSEYMVKSGWLLHIQDIVINIRMQNLELKRINWVYGVLIVLYDQKDGDVEIDAGINAISKIWIENLRDYCL